MGVPGLTRFVDEQSGILQNFKLHDSKVVIDGNNLFHYLYYNSRVPYRYGGEYEYYARCVREFFTTLHRCCVEPYVIFDGAMDVSDRKLKTCLNRAKERIQVMARISSGSNGKILPVLTYETFLNVLDEMCVTHATCLFEADEEIAALATDLDCPVISNDSDFFIFNLRSGFIPMEHMDLAIHTELRDGHKYINTQIYTIRQFCDNFRGLQPIMMPLLSTLIGNDLIEKTTLYEFYAGIDLRRNVGKRSQTKNCKGDLKIIYLIDWLKGFQKLDVAVSDVLSYISTDRKKLVGDLMQSSIDAYTKLPVNLRNQFGLSTEREKSFSSYLNIPNWFIEEFQKSEMTTFLLNSLTSRRNIFVPQVESTNEASAYECTKYMRQVVYAILFNGEETDSNLVQVKEYHRQIKDLIPCTIEPVAELKNVNIQMPMLVEIPNMSIQRKGDVILTTCVQNFSALCDMPDNFKLVFATLVYWIEHASPRITKEHVWSLIVCVIDFMVLQKLLVIESSECCLPIIDQSAPYEAVESAHTSLLKFLKGPIVNSAHPFKVQTIHGFSQFQACMWMVMHFNRLLFKPFPVPCPAVIYNGIFLYNLCTELHRRKDPVLYIQEILGRSTSISNLFDKFLVVIEACIEGGSLDLSCDFVRRKVKKSRGNATADQGRNNKFAVLALEDQ